MGKIIKRTNAIILTLAIMLSLIPSMAVQAKNLTLADWDITIGAGGDISVDTDMTVSGKSLHFTSDSAGSNAITKVPVEKGKDYTLSFYARGVKILGSANVNFAGKGYSLTPASKSYDWTYYEFNYTHTGENGEISINFGVSGKVEGFWIDSIIFAAEEEPEKNLIKNPFYAESMMSDTLTTAEGDSLEAELNNLKKADRFSNEVLERVLGGFDNLPAEPAVDITIDGNGDDWENYPTIVYPTLSTQYTIYQKLENYPLKADLKIAYTDKHFYFYCVVTDEVHEYLDSSTYWQRDSIQFTLSKTSDTYGYEIGLCYNSDEDKSSVYSTALTQAEVMTIDFKAKREGNKTHYEVAVPWQIYYDAKVPDDMLFGFLVNECQDGVRMYCLENAPGGIATHKKNEDFQFVEFIGGDKSWYGWIEGERKPTINEENTYNLFLINYGDAKDFNLTYPDGTTEVVNIGKEEGVRHEMKLNFSESGTQDLVIKVDETEEIRYEVMIMPDKAKVDKYTEIFERDLKEMDKLMRKCDKQGISYDDELAYYRIIELFVGYMQDDVKYNDYARIDYTIKELTELSETAKANLNAYLSGEKVSVPAPNYVTEATRIEGQDIYAMTETNGVYEERPVHFMGFCAFQPLYSAMPILQDMGFNHFQREIGPNVIMRPAGAVEKWCHENNGGAKVTLKVTDSEAAGGSHALSVTNDSPFAAGCYGTMGQTVWVKPNTTYTFGFKIKHKGTYSNLAFGFDNFSQRIFISQVAPKADDWTEVKGTFTTRPDQIWTIFRFLYDGPIQDCYIDDIYAYDESGENLIVNGDFEMEDDGKAWELSLHYFEDIAGVIQRARDNNLSYDLLISPHYLTAGMLETYPEMHPGYKHANPGYNVNADIAREYIEDYLRALMPLVADVPEITSICLGNEVHLSPAGTPDFYNPKWYKWLEEKYGTIEKLNEAWDADFTSFEEAEMPDREPYNTQYYDFMQFADLMFKEWFVFMKDIIREYTDKPIHVKSMNGFGEHDHQGVDRRYKTAFGFNPESMLTFSEHNGNDVIHYPSWVFSGEQGELEKIFNYDYYTSINEAPVNNSEDHIINDMDSNYIDFYADFVETSQWQGALHGRTVSSVWSWQRADGNPSSIFNGLFNYRPDCMAELSRCNNDLNRYAYEVQALRNERRDLCILYSVSSRAHLQEYMNSVYKAYEAACYNGKRPHIFNEENLGRILGECDTLVIPNAVHCKASAVAYIKQFIEKGGKVLIVGEDSLKYTEGENTPNDPETLKFIFDNSTVIPAMPDGNFLSVPTDKDLCDAVEQLLKDSKTQYVRLVDQETGDTTDMVEWMSGAKDGKLYVNIVNYNIDKPLKVKMEIGGEAVTSAKELRTQTEVGEVIDLEPYSPMLLEIESDSIFFDILGHWGEAEIDALTDKGIVNGVSATRFAPEKKVTRAEFLTLVIKAMGSDAGLYNGEFADVKAEDWYAGILATAKSRGLTAELVENGNIMPNQPITREEIMTVLVKAAEVSGKSLNGDASESFSDLGDVSSNLKSYVDKAITMGWVKGSDGKLRPQGVSTRAEAAALINRYLGE